MRLSEIKVRDTHILPFQGRYYLTGTTRDVWAKTADGADLYSSVDLYDWRYEGQIIYRAQPPQWAAYQFWAPELVFAHQRFYCVYTGKTDHTCRATGIGVAATPRGPFVDLPGTPLTPPDWECLDGHIFQDADGRYYLFFVHEWVQCQVGEMWVQELAPDFSCLIGEKKLLFRGGAAPWSSKVVDGPSVLLHEGTYYLFWSSFSAEDKYCAGYAQASSVWGPYTQSARPVIGSDSGHTSIFCGPRHQLYISFHRPNVTPHERACVCRLEFSDGQWRAGPPL